MTDEEPMQNENNWPAPKFYFNVEWDSQIFLFQEVYGLDIETQVIEYRAGDEKFFSTIKMPGIKNSADVTLINGVHRGNQEFWDWFNKIKMNTIKRCPVTIKLLDDNGEVTMTWRLENAWPTKITSEDLNSDENEIVIERLEISHDGLTIENG